MQSAWALLAALLAAGCLSPPAAPDAPLPHSGPRLSPAVAFAPPVQLTGDLGGFEPSIRAGPEGLLYVAAAKTTRPNAGTRLADWAWWSGDGGGTWRPLPMGPGEAGTLLPGLEGDLAVDARGRAYYADTYAGDLALHRWSVRGGVPSWDFSLPLLPTVDALDDRPYLAAHGDGIVHLLVNQGYDTPAPRNFLHDPASSSLSGAHAWLFTSRDGGLTWSLGWGFPGETWCAPAAARHDDRTVTVACARNAGAGASVTVYRSRDAGSSFASAWTTNHTNGPGFLNPWPAVDEAGWTYAAWLDDRVEPASLLDPAWAGSAPGKVLLARSPDGAAWERLDLTPFTGRFGMLHAAAGPAGVVAVTFHATTDLAPNATTQWHGYALLTPDARAAEPEWHLALLDPRPTGTGPVPPRDFFQNAVGPDGRVHVALQHDRPQTSAEVLASGARADVLHVAQAAGPNLPP
ncbi:MAG TPA: sialidase family protein [Candidatus Thermoplasmatota archaeon]|nr:sialidase family protein [Candidatus Thermoplasmatota archaeon]